MSTATHTLEQRILAALARQSTALPDLARHLGVDATTVLRTLRQLGSLKQVTCQREDGALLWSVADGTALPDLPPPPVAARAPALQPAPARSQATPLHPVAAPARCAPIARPAPVRTRTARPQGITEDLYDALHATPWLSAGQLIQRLPSAKCNVIYALLSQRVKAGDFIAHPATGRNRRYALAGTPLPPVASVAPPRPSRPRTPQLHPTIVGVASAFEQCLRFIAWAQHLHGEPTWQQIHAQFGVSRATAFRWLGGWRAAQEALAA